MSWPAVAVFVAALAGQSFWIARSIDALAARLDSRIDALDRQSEQRVDDPLFPFGRCGKLFLTYALARQGAARGLTCGSTP